MSSQANERENHAKLVSIQRLARLSKCGDKNVEFIEAKDSRGQEKIVKA